MLDGWEKDNPPTIKMLPVEVDVPEYVAKMALMTGVTPLDMAIGDLILIAFYYLLQIGEYTCKALHNDSKQTIQFKIKDLTFFKRVTNGSLRCLPRDLPPSLLLTANGATLKLDNQKNSWKGVCGFHKANGDQLFCPVRALARRYQHITTHTSNTKEVLSAYWDSGEHPRMVTAEHISQSLKLAASMLEYPSKKGIPIQRVNTHLLRSGGANALALLGYSDTEIQKMGRWRGATFKEYIREELASFSTNMSRDMKRTFNFVIIAGNTFHDVTSELVLDGYAPMPATRSTKQF